MRLSLCTRIALTCLLAVGLALTPSAGARAEPPAGDVRDIPVEPRGYGTCFSKNLIFGKIAIATGCYVFYLVRTQTGSYLAFGPPGPLLVPAGRVVPLHNVRARLRYLVPLPVVVSTMAVNTAQYVAVDWVVASRRIVARIPRQSSERPVELAFGQR